jgi:acyl-CoA synthetase (AMP-forming)/AMP-acid ligase II
VTQEVVHVAEAGVKPITNIAQVLDEAVSLYGDRLAFGDREHGATYRDLRNLARAVRDRLRASTTPNVSLTAGNSLVVPATLFGAAAGGRIYAPINGRLPESAQQALLDRLSPVTVVDDSWLEGVVAPDDDALYDSTVPTAVPAVLIFTSGTTAEPKAAVLDHSHLIASSLRYGRGEGGGEEALVLNAPPFHMSNVALLLGAVYAGRRIVPYPLERFDADRWFDLVEEEEITHASIVPTMLHRLVEALERRPGRAPSLRRLSYGSARTPRPVLLRALELLPHVGFFNAYGMTETAGAVAGLTPEEHRLALMAEVEDARARLFSVGRPLPGVAIRIVGADGREAAVGQTGEITIRGQQVSGCYIGLPPRVDADGWMSSGDDGWMDADGYLFCAGRSDDTIIRGGENISTAEIEDAILRTGLVGEAVVVGLPDREWGEQIAALVTPHGQDASTLPEELMRQLRDVLGALKTPEIVVVTDQLPLTATDKITRRATRQLIQLESARSTAR